MTSRIFVATLFTILLFPWGALSADDETTSVKVKDLELKVPATWKKEAPASRLRLAQFRIAPVEGEDQPSELAIFSFGASDVSQNIKRWIGQFQADGRKVKVTTGEAVSGKYVFVELSGTYNKSVGPPVAGKTEAVPNSRVLAVILVTKENSVYYLKMVGKNRSVAAQATALRTSFGADASKEQEAK